MKVLVVDDDLELRGLIGFALRQAGYLVVDATNGPEALQVFEREQPDLAILDVNLPGMSGFEVCQQIRAESSAPIMMLTVRNSEEDQVKGLDLGADDYLTKPFSPRTLLARVRALLRRTEIDRPSLLATGDIELDVERQAVRVHGAEAIRLTNLEFRLLQYLLANAGHTIPTDRLTGHVWGYRGIGDRQLLKQLVHRLRQKVEQNPTEPQYVLTVSGIGYMLQTRNDQRPSGIDHQPPTTGD
jgi:DNA-binding response OmpR family regulator